MQYLTKNNILLAIVCVGLFFQIMDFFKVDDSDWALKEQVYLEKIARSDEVIKLARDSINLIRKENEIIKKNITTDSVIIWNSDRRYRDSIRAIYNPR